MEFNATIDLIIKDLDEARAIIDDLKRYPGVPAIQVELAKAKCRSAGEIIALLKNIQSKASFTGEAKPSEEKIEPVIPAINIPSPAVKIEESSHVSKKSSESSILADNFSHLSNRFNEQLGNLKEEEDLIEILKSKHLSTLSEAIGVNDRFLFLREIFNGSLDAYTLVISRLDHVNNIDDAKAVIMSYTGNDSSNTAVKQLLNLVKRKLHTDG